MDRALSELFKLLDISDEGLSQDLLALEAKYGIGAPLVDLGTGTETLALEAAPEGGLFCCLLYDSRGFEESKEEKALEIGAHLEHKIEQLSHDKVIEVEKTFGLGPICRLSYGYAYPPVHYDIWFGKSLEDSLHLHAETEINGNFEFYSLEKGMVKPASPALQDVLTWFSGSRIELSKPDSSEFYSCKDGKIELQKGQLNKATQELATKIMAATPASLLNYLKQKGITVFVWSKPHLQEIYATKAIGRYLPENKFLAQALNQPPKFNTEIETLKISDVQRELQYSLQQISEIYEQLNK